MTQSQLARVRAADKERKRLQRAKRSESQVERDRQQDNDRNQIAQSNRRDELSTEQQEQERSQNAEAHRARRKNMTVEGRCAVQEQDTAARQAAREAMPDEERQAIQENNTAAHQAARNTMTEEDHERHKEAERFRRRSCQYQKGLSYYKDFEPSIIPGGRHYFSRYTDGAQEHERLRRLYQNPGFKQLIRAYNNVSAFTSMGSSRFRPLNFDESITRRRSGVYNFRVQGYVSHRM
ncbi:Helitron helicase [Phytophthora megakarya]|uniref:Helitron helicase n=1 Tax=Phytophthora megakarya TaxID=4795 RepID=A0A225UGX5_9STRA|nr:Helitron helicase [Phytophthora megakarya]